MNSDCWSPKCTVVYNSVHCAFGILLNNCFYEISIWKRLKKGNWTKERQESFKYKNRSLKRTLQGWNIQSLSEVTDLQYVRTGDPREITYSEWFIAKIRKLGSKSEFLKTLSMLFFQIFRRENCTTSSSNKFIIIRKL